MPSTVLSGAEERFAEERPGWNFSKNKNDPGLENWVQNYTQTTFAVKATSPAALLTSKRLHGDGSKHFSRFPGLACVACVCNIDIEYRIRATSLGMWLEDGSKNKNEIWLESWKIRTIQAGTVYPPFFGTRQYCTHCHTACRNAGMPSAILGGDWQMTSLNLSCSSRWPHQVARR